MSTGYAARASQVCSLGMDYIIYFITSLVPTLSF